MPVAGRMSDGGELFKPFATTHWTVVLSARDETSAQAREALERLCRTCWYHDLSLVNFPPDFQAAAGNDPFRAPSIGPRRVTPP